MPAQQPDRPDLGGIHDKLEIAYIEEFLRAFGYTLDGIKALPENEARWLMTAASQFASVRLTEVEMRSHLVEDLHGVAQRG